MSYAAPQPVWMRKKGRVWAKKSQAKNGPTPVDLKKPLNL